MSSRSVGYFVLCGAILLTLITAGCAHHYYNAYDPYYHDYHYWGAREDGYYQRWVAENQMDPHHDYRHLSRQDQRRYWDWRHREERRDHDHDRDHDYR